MTFWKPTANTRRLDKRILDLTAKLDAADRAMKVVEAERDAMAMVIARDRQRVQAESAAFARQRAEAEGTANDRRSG